MGDAVESFGFDERGRLVLWRRGHRDVAYAHSADGSVLAAGDVRFVHDSRGRLARALTPAGAVVYEHDARGRRFARKAAEETRYEWDRRGRLLSWREGELSSEMGYDPTGRLRSVRTSGAGEVLEEREYRFEGLDLAAFALHGEGVALELLYEGAGGAVARARMRGREIAYAAVRSPAGDVLELLDETGTVFARYRYGPWGGPLRADTRGTRAVAPDDAALIARWQPLRWAGYLWEPRSRLYCLSLRWYDPATCRFLTPDPVGADGTGSPYTYCRGDPVRRVDPSGLWDAEVHYTLTREWARRAGFDEREAEAIARADSRSDTLHPGNRLRYAHHHYTIFGARRNARRLFERAVGEGSLEYLGWAVHSAQDAVGHGVLGPLVHFLHEHIDTWERRPALLRERTEAVTMDLLREYLATTRTVSREDDVLAPAEDQEDAQVDEDVHRDGGQQASGRKEEEGQPEP